jgi:hypothetical protein
MDVTKNIEDLLETTRGVQKELDHSIQLLQNRDRQISAALDGLQSIALNSCCTSCREAAIVAVDSIKRMKEIYKELLT